MKKLYQVLIFIFFLIYITSQQPTASDSCIEFNQNFGVCKKCLDGYYLQYFFCVSCNPLCSCSGNGSYCDSCINITYQSRTFMSYRSGDVCVLCNTTISFCIQCSTDGLNCSKCIQGHFLTEDAQCSNTTCTQDCEICQDQLSCKFCSSGFWLDKQTKLCINGSLTQPNCSIFQNQTYCRICIVGYTAINGTCESCAVQNCAVCTNDTETCLLCLPSYIPSNNSCVATGLSNCIAYTGGVQSATCLICQPGFYNAQGSCTNCQNCLICSQSFICQSQCFQGFTPFNFACIQSSETKFSKYYLILIAFVFILSLL